MAALARFGYTTHGIIYLLVGTLAGVAAFDWRAQTTDAYGALATVLSRRWGELPLAVIAAGLIAFSLWSLLQCLADTERLGKSAMSIFVRIGFLSSSLGHLLLCFAALNLIFGWEPAQANAEAGIKDWTRWAFAQPGGRWIVGVLSVLVIGGGVSVARNGWRGDFKSRLVDDAHVRQWAMPIGRVGLIAQGTTLTLMGCFLLSASFQADPDTARGLAGVLGSLKRQPYGWILLAAAAFGLTIYGIYGLVEAACRKVEPARRPKQPQ